MGIVQGFSVRLTTIISNSPQKYSLVKPFIFVDKKQLYIDCVCVGDTLARKKARISCCFAHLFVSLYSISKGIADSWKEV